MIYREKGLFLQTLHPAATCAFTGGVVLLALVINHPLYLAALLVVCLAALAGLHALRSGAGLFLFCLPVVVLLLLINPLVAPHGTTVLWRGPFLPGLGSLTVSLEAVGFACGMALRLLAVLAAFLVYSAALNPDRVFNLFAGRAPRAAVIFLLALRVYPALLRDYARIREAQTARGVDFDAGSVVSRLASRMLVARGMLATSLERALEIAESMYARGFGSGPRTVYFTESWRPRDGLVLAGVLVAVTAGLLASLSGRAVYNYYPVLDPVFRWEALVPLGVLIPALLTPALLQWGWNRWLWLRSKI